MNVLIPMYVYTVTLLQNGSERTGRFLRDHVERARQRDDRGIALSAEMIGLAAVVIIVAMFLAQSNLGQSLLNAIYKQLQKLDQIKGPTS